MTDIIAALNWRYATKKFDPTRKLEPEKLSIIIESIRLTASSYGLQPYQVIVVSNDQLKSKLRLASFNQSQVEDCSHFIILATEMNVDEEYIGTFMNKVAQQRALDRDVLSPYEKYISGIITQLPDSDAQLWKEKQVYIALGNALIAAALLRVDSCAMEGFVKEEYDEILNLGKSGLKSCVALALGYRHEEDPAQHLAKIRREEGKMVVVLKN